MRDGARNTKRNVEKEKMKAREREINAIILCSLCSLNVSWSSFRKEEYVEWNQVWQKIDWHKLLDEKVLKKNCDDSSCRKRVFHDHDNLGNYSTLMTE